MVARTVCEMTSAVVVSGSCIFRIFGWNSYELYLCLKWFHHTWRSCINNNGVNLASSCHKVIILLANTSVYSYSDRPDIVIFSMIVNSHGKRPFPFSTRWFSFAFKFQRLRYFLSHSHEIPISIGKPIPMHISSVNIIFLCSSILTLTVAVGVNPKHCMLE